MVFQQRITWIYDLHSLISSKRISHGQTTYHHEEKVELDLLENQNNWEYVHNILQFHGKLLVTPIIETLKQFERTYKRNNT